MVAAIREAGEETGVSILPAWMSLVHIQYITKDFPHHPYINFYFRAAKWKGNPCVKEPEKIIQGKWFSKDEMPIEQMVPNLPGNLSFITQGILYSTYHMSV